MESETNDYNSIQQNVNKENYEQTIPSKNSAFSIYDKDLDDEVSIFKVRNQEVLKKITQDLVTTFSVCNPDFDYELNANPRRVLTKPSKPVHNDGYDNENWDYILYVNDILGGQEGQQYQILDILGKGTFGQVVKCQNVKTKEIVALKVIKNKPAYYNQSLVEVAILDILNNQYDKEDKHNIIRLKDTFIFHGHLCIIFEMLSVNLYELIKQNQFRGLSTNLVRVFVSQLLDALCVLNKSKIIHCDLKPENILLRNLESPALKVIDFGSACHENQTTYTYIQSRFYRSIEVLLGLPYTSSIDMWSLGCIAAELYLGLPLFPGSSEYNQISRIVNMLGIPPLYTIEKGKNAQKYFKKVGVKSDGKSIYQLKSMEEYMEENNTVEQPSKRYFNGDTLDEIINLYPITRKGLSQREIDKEMQNRTVFIDFLHGLLNLNPLERWSPQEARLHPFITGEKYLGPYVPSTRIKSIPPISVPINSYSNNQVTSTASTPINITTKGNTRRPRANTISSSRVQNVPPQLQRLAAFNPQNNINSNNYSYNGPTQYQIIQQQSLSEMANLENISSTMNATTSDNSHLSALLNTTNGYDSSNISSNIANNSNYLNGNGSQSSQISTPNQQMLTINNQQMMNAQNDSQYLNNIFSDMHIDPSLYNMNLSVPLSSSLDNLSSSNPRRVRNNRRMDYNISTKHFRRQSFAGSSFSYLNSINNTRSNSSANISQNQNIDSNLQGTSSTHNNQQLSDLTSSIINQHHSYSSSSLLNIPEHQDYSNNTDNLATVDPSFMQSNTSNIVGSLNHTDQYIPNSNTISDQLYIPNTNTVTQIPEHSTYNVPTTNSLINIHDTIIYNKNDNNNSQSPGSISRNVSIDILSDDSNNSVNKRLTPSQQQQGSRSSSSLAHPTSLHDTKQNSIEDEYCGKKNTPSSLHKSTLTPNLMNNTSSTKDESTIMSNESDYCSSLNNYDSSQGPHFTYSKDNYDAPFMLPIPYTGDLIDSGNNYSKWNMQRRASAPMIAFKKQQKSSYLSQRNSNLAYGSSYQSSYSNDSFHINTYNSDYNLDDRSKNPYNYYNSNSSTIYSMNQDQKQLHHTRRVRYKSGPAESNPPIANAATGLFMYNNPTQNISYQSLPELVTNQSSYSNSVEMDKPNLYSMTSSNSTSQIQGLNQSNPNSAFHYTYNAAIDSSQQNNYYDPAYHDKFLSSYLFQKRHSVPTLHFMTKNSNLKQNNNNSNNNNNNNYTNYNNQDYSMKAQKLPTYLPNNSYEDINTMYGSGSKINKGKSYLNNKTVNNKSYSNSSNAININGGVNKYSNYYQNSSFSRSLSNVQLMDDQNNNSIKNISSSNSSKKYYIDKSQRSNTNLNDLEFSNNGNDNFYNSRRRGSQNYQQHRKAKSMDNPNFGSNSSIKLDNYIRNKNKQYDSILSEKEAFVSKNDNSYSPIDENNIRYENEEDHIDEEEDDIIEVEVNYDDDNYSYDNESHHDED
ncbi:hypothetical protein BCR36DRAFT_359718 [Piromyces finnis]|uniref:Protein kinase domain-containing protein n=1 Tax=Piromyces finnis TaxID=1754191 RepID=A0A1Y1V1V4_9FUNG|nr:hypothetical protein BCR36DRAFT_359718 [Piromyces finnis]|eukprot:ORX44554.1 hypothetical protein BCR36DRAFT_359718 [Piromyces finnis]